MSEAIDGVLNGALIQEMRLSILSNNISNINTVGFKEDRLFQVPMTEEYQNPDVQVDGIAELPELSIGNLPVGTFTNFAQGKLEHTGNQLDLALEGKGFFCIKTPEGVHYTRKGTLTVNNDGVLVTQEGHQVIGKGGKIELEAKNITIDGQGNIIVDDDVVDTLKIADFDKPNALQKVGSTRFATADPLTEAINAEGFTVLQGFVEHSNVEAINAMSEMIDVLRGYEAYQKVIQSLNDTTLAAINDVGPLA